jgi:hypothetical protein
MLQSNSICFKLLWLNPKIEPLKEIVFYPDQK